MAKSFSESQFINLLSQTMIKAVEEVFEATDVHCKIFTFLPLRSLIRCQLVNKLWNHHALNPASAERFSISKCYEYDERTNLIKQFYIQDISRFRQCTFVHHYIDTGYLWSDSDPDSDSEEEMIDNSKQNHPKEKDKLRQEHNLQILKMCDQLSNFTRINYLIIDLQYYKLIDTKYNIDPYINISGLLSCVEKNCYDIIDTVRYL